MENSEQNIQRRSAERMNSTVQMKIFFGNSVYFGNIHNYSNTGMYISTKKFFIPVNAVFEIYVPSGLEVLKLPVRVCRIVKMEDVNYGMGVELLDVPENYEKMMKVHGRKNKHYLYPPLF